MRVYFRAPARRELDDAIDWYRSCPGDVAQRFVMALDSCIERMVRFPRASRSDEFGFRHARVPGFPYGLHHRLEEDNISVYGVRHEKQEPIRWEKRVGRS